MCFHFEMLEMRTNSVLSLGDTEMRNNMLLLNVSQFSSNNLRQYLPLATLRVSNVEGMFSENEKKKNILCPTM